jgi:hypothetical protein
MAPVYDDPPRPLKVLKALAEYYFTLNLTSPAFLPSR